MLRGRMHELHSGLAVTRGTSVLYQHVAVARLVMRDFSDAFLSRYMDEAGASVTQTVGGYRLEGIGIHLFERIEGDHFTILGLPLLPLLDFLRRQGIVA
jgi:septum formation protein